MSDCAHKILYKYANWDNKYHKRLITHNEIYFASAKQFNDPFDSNIPFRIDLRSDEDNLNVIRQLIRTNNPLWNDSQIEVEANNILKQENWGKEENKAEAEKSRLQFMFEKNGIFSLSEVKDNILMWSHYSDSHRGFCIGFNVESLERFLDDYSNHQGFPCVVYKIRYSRLFPILVPGTDLLDSKFIIDAFTIKADDWNYEKEWRYILTGTTSHKMLLGESIISEVILGCRMPEDNKEEIIKIVKGKNIKPKLFIAERSKDSFSLQFEELTFLKSQS